MADSTTNPETMTNVVMIGNFLVYNLGIFAILMKVKNSVNLAALLSEKEGVAPAAAGITAVTGPASYSRVSGFIGSIVMAIFFWALGNVILYKALGGAAGLAEIKALMSGLSTYFLAGSALFLPYAFNQLKGIFS
jgi:hypothetical protein